VGKAGWLSGGVLGSNHVNLGLNTGQGGLPLQVWHPHFNSNSKQKPGLIVKWNADMKPMVVLHAKPYLTQPLHQKVGLSVTPDQFAVFWHKKTLLGGVVEFCGRMLCWREVKSCDLTACYVSSFGMLLNSSTQTGQCYRSQTKPIFCYQTYGLHLYVSI